MVNEEHNATMNPRLKQAEDALAAGEFVTAHKLFKNLAEVGSRPAMLELAYMYERGVEGVPQDYAISRYWYERAWEEARYDGAALALGKFYYLGHGVSIDFNKSFYYYSQLEQHNNAVGLLRLGVMYQYGKGISQDIEHARALYKKSTKLGNIYARKNLGVLEVARGNIVIGLALWGAAFIQGTVLTIFKPHDRRLQVW